MKLKTGDRIRTTETISVFGSAKRLLAGSVGVVECDADRGHILATFNNGEHWRVKTADVVVEEKEAKA